MSFTDWENCCNFAEEKILMTKEEKQYYNSPNLDLDAKFSYLLADLREPQNEEEKKWQKEMKEMFEQGINIDLPFN